MTQLIVAVDTAEPAEIEKLLEQLAPTGVLFKFGAVAISVHGVLGINRMLAKQRIPFSRLFWDMKYHDIPNTVALTLFGLKAPQISDGLQLGKDQPIAPALLNVHALGGHTMMLQAANMIRLHMPATKLIAVTVLTSLSDADMQNIGFAVPVQAIASSLALQAKAAGLHGVVCSGHEVKTLKGVCGSDFLTIVPGVRLGNDVQDQSRVVTPYEAASVGADYIVMGRDITGAPNIMLAAVEAVEEQIGRAIRRACT